MSDQFENAVSPVVAVMLMLVVTIIVAAIVSAFAGGFASSQEKTPQASISAEYSQKNGMTICHTGGDVLTITDFQILLTLSKNLGATKDIHTETINKGIISRADGTMWLNAKGTLYPRFIPGETVYITAINCTAPLTPHMSTTGVLNQTENLGGSFFLDFVTNDGRRITRTEVTIKP